MAGVARTGDTVIGICCHSSHNGCIHVSGQLISGSGNVKANSSQTVRLGDTAIASCGHTGQVVSGSGSIKTNSIPTARIGDSVVGNFSGTIVGGSGSVVSS